MRHGSNLESLLEVVGGHIPAVLLLHRVLFVHGVPLFGIRSIQGGDHFGLLSLNASFVDNYSYAVLRFIDTRI